MSLKIELVEGGILPQRATEGSVGYDLYARHIDYDPMGQFYVAYMGFKLDLEIIPNFKWAGLILPRSGLGTKYGMRLLNTVGVIDTDYRGEVIIKFTCDKDPVFEEQQRIAQLVIVPVFTGELKVVDRLVDTVRGTGGFGHTGVN